MIWIALGWLLSEPAWLLGVLVFLLLRRFLPDPGRLFSALSRVGSLRAQVEASPANATARLELARLYLELRRPGKALAQLEEARRRFPRDAELLFTSGQALLELGRYDESIAALDAALESSARVRFGLPYLLKGDASFGAGRFLEAVQAYEEYLRTNSSDVGGYVRLARAALRLGRRAEARRALDEGRLTYEALRGGLRRRAFGPWLRLQWLRATRFAAPGPLAVGVGWAALLALAAFAVGRWWLQERALSQRRERMYREASELGERMMAAYSRCGSVDVAQFVGVYHDEAPSDAGARSPVRIAKGRILERELGPEGPLAEWCLTRVLERGPGRLRAEAIVHEDVGDPGDAWLAVVTLEQLPTGVRLTLESEAGSETRELRRR